jgi:hypothetical protein
MKGVTVDAVVSTVIRRLASAPEADARQVGAVNAPEELREGIMK